MRRIGGVTFLTIGLIALCSSAAVAEIALDGTGVLHQYCADGEATPHPKKIVLRQLMTTDRLATFGGTGFAAIYTSGRETQQTGTMSVRARIERVDGSREKLNRMVAYQQNTGDAEALARFPIAVRQGDTVVWRYKFTDFGEVPADGCFMLIGATIRP